MNRYTAASVAACVVDNRIKDTKKINTDVGSRYFSNDKIFFTRAE